MWSAFSMLSAMFRGTPFMYPLKSYISKIMCVLFSLHIYFPVFRIHNLFFGYFWIYFLFSRNIFCFPDIFSVFRKYFLFSGYIFCCPEIFSVFLDIFSVFRIYYLFSGYIFGYIPRFPVNNKPRKCEDQTNLCQRWSKNGACALDKSFVTR